MESPDVAGPRLEPAGVGHGEAVIAFEIGFVEILQSGSRCRTGLQFGLVVAQRAVHRVDGVHHVVGPLRRSSCLVRGFRGVLGEVLEEGNADLDLPRRRLPRAVVRVPGLGLESQEDRTPAPTGEPSDPCGPSFGR